MLTYIAIFVAIVLVVDVFFHDKLKEIIKEIIKTQDATPAPRPLPTPDPGPTPMPQPAPLEQSAIIKAFLSEIISTVQTEGEDSFERVRYLMSKCEDFSKGLEEEKEAPVPPVKVEEEKIDPLPSNI